MVWPLNILSEIPSRRIRISLGRRHAEKAGRCAVLCCSTPVSSGGDPAPRATAIAVTLPRHSAKRANRDDHAHDFRGAFGHLGDADVPTEPLDLVVLDEADAAVDLKYVLQNSLTPARIGLCSWAGPHRAGAFLSSRVTRASEKPGESVYGRVHERNALFNGAGCVRPAKSRAIPSSICEERMAIRV